MPSGRVKFVPSLIQTKVLRAKNMAKTQSPTHNTLLCLRPRLNSVRYCNPFQLKTVFQNQLIPHK